MDEVYAGEVRRLVGTLEGIHEPLAQAGEVLVDEACGAKGRKSNLIKRMKNNSNYQVPTSPLQ